MITTLDELLEEPANATNNNDVLLANHIVSNEQSMKSKGDQSTKQAIKMTFFSQPPNSNLSDTFASIDQRATSTNVLRGKKITQRKLIEIASMKLRLLPRHMQEFSQDEQTYEPDIDVYKQHCNQSGFKIQKSRRASNLSLNAPQTPLDFHLLESELDRNFQNQAQSSLMITANSSFSQDRTHNTGSSTERTGGESIKSSRVQNNNDCSLSTARNNQNNNNIEQNSYLKNESDRCAPIHQENKLKILQLLNHRKTSKSKSLSKHSQESSFPANAQNLPSIRTAATASQSENQISKNSSQSKAQSKKTIFIPMKKNSHKPIPTNENAYIATEESDKGDSSGSVLKSKAKGKLTFSPQKQAIRIHQQDSNNLNAQTSKMLQIITSPEEDFLVTSNPSPKRFPQIGQGTNANTQFTNHMTGFAGMVTKHEGVSIYDQIKKQTSLERTARKEYYQEEINDSLFSNLSSYFDRKYLIKNNQSSLLVKTRPTFPAYKPPSSPAGMSNNNTGSMSPTQVKKQRILIIGGENVLRISPGSKSNKKTNISCEQIEKQHTLYRRNQSENKPFTNFKIHANNIFNNEKPISSNGHEEWREGGEDCYNPQPFDQHIHITSSQQGLLKRRNKSRQCSSNKSQFTMDTLEPWESQDKNGLILGDDEDDDHNINSFSSTRNN